MLTVHLDYASLHLGRGLGLLLSRTACSKTQLVCNTTCRNVYNFSEKMY